MHVYAMNSAAARTQRLLACLGDPSRFRVVATLFGGEYCVTDLAGKVGLSQSCTTRHLQALLREGLVTRDRQGKKVMFRLSADEPLSRALIEWALASTPGPPAFDWPAVTGADIHLEMPDLPLQDPGIPTVAPERARSPKTTDSSASSAPSRTSGSTTDSTRRTGYETAQVSPSRDSEESDSESTRRSEIEDFLL